MTRRNDFQELGLSIETYFSRPEYVIEGTLLAISEAVHRWGTYPLDLSLERASSLPPKGPRS
ncbi:MULTISPECIES: hypothetical protein [unclassified Thiocapsa]|uniref:hypothetical protein n=1 Tax=unclassified Thiocapsa TaxID=2641286 RepID=UPI0035AE3E93